MRVTFLKPFGVQVTDVDVSCPDHMNRIRDLLWANAVVFLPAGAASPGSQPTHLDESISALGNLFGQPDRCHPVHPNSSESDDVHIVESSGDSGNPPDSFLFHSDMCWRVNPPRVTVLCGRRIPSRGGNTLFQNTNIMYNLLSPELQDKAANHTFKHSFKLGYGRVGRDTSEVSGDITASHPGVIMHPETGSPLLYVNEAFTSSCHGMEAAESEALLKKIFSQASSGEHTMIHKWKLHDVLIWDNLGILHLGVNDYDEKRRMHRLVANDPKLLLERYVCEDVSVEEIIDDLNNLIAGEVSSDWYTNHANRYDRDMRKVEYVVPSVATDLLVKHVKKNWTEEQEMPLILDIAAGTGRNAIHLAHNHELDNIEAMDISDGMLNEARRRKLYKRYYTANANEELALASNIYDAVICTGGLFKGLIKPQPAIGNMIRLAKAGGFVVITMRSHGSEYIEAVKTLVGEGLAEVAEVKAFVGIRTMPKIEHTVYVLRVL